MKALTINTNALWRILCIGLIFYSISSFGQTYRPSRNIIFATLADWETPSNWEGGNVPPDNSTIEYGNADNGWGGYTIEIGFDLASSYPNLSFDSNNEISILTISNGGVVNVTNFSVDAKSSITIEEGAQVTIEDDLTINTNSTSLTICGELNLNATLTASNALDLTVCENGIFNAESLIISSSAEVDISGSVNISGSAFLNNNITLDINSTGELNILGGLDFGAGTINLDGDLYVKGESDFDQGGSGSTLNISSTGNAKLEGDLIADVLDINIVSNGLLEVIGQVSSLTNDGSGGNWYLDGTMVVHEGIDVPCSKTITIEIPDGSDGGIIIDYEGEGNRCEANSGDPVLNTCATYGTCEAINNPLDKTYSPTVTPDLPVNLISFTGTKTLNGFLLEWTTASEQNSERFDIEVSDDKRNWQVINSLAAAGNSDVKLDYEYLDISQSKYYRLAQYDFDGTVAYYGIVTSLNEGELNVSVYPTFVENGELSKVYFEGISEDQKITYQVFDIKGKEIKNEYLITSTSGNFLTSFMMPNSIKGGLYIVKVNVGKYQKTFKIIKK
ncbi:T9SS type A sorting domain-containing protein [Flammeovirga pectinis]|uniref:T9SS type A sorting domain-containing protein n=1 Tax=Flammeovirga pectinis TaxID=2494373 RepID=A0A3Q9FKI6_9BACT|nr:T9SS type A sorting domain-containing protein [Flammeovirga pectinis]AZQ62206.1 T9SS type A sorting domain-containing protein [Flammeovirga pectinis]